MEYANLKDMYTYSGQTSLKFPKGNPTGNGNTIYLLTPNHFCASDIFNNKFIQLHESMYKMYFIDTRYKTKIGHNNINENMTGEINKLFENPIKGATRVNPVQLDGKMKSGKNMVVDLGHWMELWFENYPMRNTRDLCTDFFNFLTERITVINNLSTSVRKNILYVPLDRWPIEDLSFQLWNMVNPIAILMCALYKYPEILKTLPQVISDILIVDQSNGQFMKIDTTSLNKDSFNLIRTQLKKFKIFEGYKMEDDEENEEHHNRPISKDKEAIIQAVVQKVNDELAEGKDLIDLTDEEEEEDQGDGILTAEEIRKIEELADDTIDHSDDSDTEEELIDELEDSAKKKIFMTKFIPDRSKSQLKKIEELSARQQEIYTKQSAKVLESKIIDVVSLEGTTETLNPSLYTSNFKDFDNSYVKKKLDMDIFNAVDQISKTDYPIFITNITEEDTSDPLNLKRTLTYELEDINGKKMTMKFDIPIVIDGCYIYIGGGKKILGHQHILKPIVKSGPDEVQLVTFHNKAFMYRKGKTDMVTGKLKKYIAGNEDKYKVKFGNTHLKNGNLPSTLGIDTFARSMSEMTVGNAVFIFDFNNIKKVLTDKNIDLDGYDESKHILVGYDKKTKKALYIDSQESFSDLVMIYMDTEDIKKVGKVKSNDSLMYSNIKILGKFFPMIFIMLYCEGFTKVMEKCKIDYAIVNPDEAKKYNPNNWGSIKCNDGVIMWKRHPMKNTLLMNGFSKFDVSEYSVEDLDNKETYIDMVTLFSTYSNAAFNIDHWKNFILDEVTKEILADFGYPTDLIEVLAYCNSLLTSNQYLDINNEENLRIRSAEIIPELIYNEVADAYNKYRKAMHRKDKANMSIKPDAIIKKLVSGLETVDEVSDLNPILESEKKHSVTYKGSHGINMEQAISLKRRMYDDSMVGVCGIITSNDGKVGITRQLTVNPSITSTRGYIQVTPKDERDKLTTDKLCSCSEMLTPMVVSHDDPPRVSMTFKQSQYSMPIADGSPVLIGNKFESFLPYHTTDTFSKVAKQDGTIIDYSDGVYIMQYKDGTYDSFDTNEHNVRNASQGFYLTAKFDTKLKVGDKFKANEVVAWNDKIYSKNKDLSASMNMGALCKVAIMPQQNQFEDSTPITSSLSKRLASEVVVAKHIFIPMQSTVRKIVEIGDEIKTGQDFIIFDSTTGDKDIDEYLRGFDAQLQEDIRELTADNLKSKYSGTVCDIEIMCTTELENLTPSLREIVENYMKKIKKSNKLLDKYKNEGDNNYYKCGKLIKNTDEIIKPNDQGKVKGEHAEDGVFFTFYIKFIDYVKKGDKVATYSALKGVVSEVLEPGMEQYSNFRPNEEISTTLAPGAILARKIGSVLLALFGNKVLLECKRKMKSIYFETDYNQTY